ncbi:MAG: DUF2975 domain-containing protein [Oscillospiraceae bacterium]|nr:DUF2975 domain-containing protein [Oscillospiraceae bacterium]MBQ5339195.1 DUF2975 domain-containing protein [Oscillospiraceae bacterium]MBQ9907995.1 DUF2975 domain-containing protein [Oscillospiraceae bacterium]
MKIKWDSEKSLFLSRCLTIATLILGVVSLFCIPIITEWYDAISGALNGGKPIHVELNIALYLSAILGIIALWQLLTMLNRFAKHEVFVKENAICLRLIAWCSFGVAAVWLALTFWRFTAFFVAFIAAFAGLLLRVMKNMLEAAIELREENDFTI